MQDCGSINSLVKSFKNSVVYFGHVIHYSTLISYYPLGNSIGQGYVCPCSLACWMNPLSTHDQNLQIFRLKVVLVNLIVLQFNVS